jgi:hypothetical protein
MLVGFVDDANSSTNEICALKQHDAQVWHDILNADGGQKVELPKCSFHALYFCHLTNGTPKVENAARWRNVLPSVTGMATLSTFLPLLPTARKLLSVARSPRP